MSLLTPMRLEVCHAKTSLFLSRNESNSVSSFDVKFWEIITILSGTLGSNGPLLVSHSGSIGMLVGATFVFTLSGATAILCFLILQTIHIPMAWSESLLYVRCIFLAVMD
jgi:hypothetical protein